jgi:hypothetical protein
MMINEYNKQAMIDWDTEFLAGNPNLSDSERDVLTHEQSRLVRGLYTPGLAQNFRGRSIISQVNETQQLLNQMLQQYKPSLEAEQRKIEALRNLNKNE